MSASEVPYVEPTTSSRARGAPPAGMRRISAALPAGLEGPGAQLRELVEVVLRRVRKRPLTAVAAAVGLGFLVGGALSFRAGRAALAAGARYVAREVLKQVL